MKSHNLNKHCKINVETRGGEEWLRITYLVTNTATFAGIINQLIIFSFFAHPNKQDLFICYPICNDVGTWTFKIATTIYVFLCNFHKVTILTHHSTPVISRTSFYSSLIKVKMQTTFLPFKSKCKQWSGIICELRYQAQTVTYIIKSSPRKYLSNKY